MSEKVDKRIKVTIDQLTAYAESGSKEKKPHPEEYDKTLIYDESDINMNVWLSKYNRYLVL